MKPLLVKTLILRPRSLPRDRCRMPGLETSTSPRRRVTLRMADLRRIGPWLALAACAAWCAWFARGAPIDDAFITFRYAANLVAGHGLVFNPGERVEGYSNFLWTILIAAGLRLGIDPVGASKALGAGFAVLAVAGAAVSLRHM